MFPSCLHFFNCTDCSHQLSWPASVLGRSGLFSMLPFLPPPLSLYDCARLRDRSQVCGTNENAYGCCQCGPLHDPAPQSIRLQANMHQYASLELALRLLLSLYYGLTRASPESPFAFNHL